MKWPLLFLFFCLAIFSFGQSIERSVFSAGGLSTTLMDFTIGETFTSSISNQNVFISQGFQQTNLLHIGISEYLKPASVLLYPNPARSEFSLSYPNFTESFNLLIYDLQGKLIEDFKQVKSNELFDVASLAAGTYVLRAHDLNGLELSHHLLIKL